MYQNLQPVSLSRASGKVAYNMTNDCLFHIVLQNNEYALKGLIASLLHLDPESISSVEVKNPVSTGQLVSQKFFYLDLLVMMNDNTLISIEMQVKDLKNWVPRSLSYLCREFNSLHHGDDYNDAKSVYQIGFLDYTLFLEHPEFYATYRMCNIKDHQVYSDKFTLSVIELNHIELATKEDRAFGIDKWAYLFKSTTWEEIRMLAQSDQYIASAAESMYSSVTDPDILSILRVRQEEIDGDIHRRERLAEQDKQIAEQDKQIAEQDKQIAEQDRQIAKQDKRLEEQDWQIAEQDKQIAEQNKQIAELREQNAELKEQNASFQRQLDQLTKMLSEK